MWIFTFQSKNIRVGEKELREKKKKITLPKGPQGHLNASLST